MNETLAVPGRPEPLQLRTDADGTIRWTVGDCTGNEPTRAAAIAAAELYLQVRVVREVRPTFRAEVRQVGPSSRRPGAGPTIGVVYVSSQVPAGFHVPVMCAHGIKAGHCDACEADYCHHQGALPHDCFRDAPGGAP